MIPEIGHFALWLALAVSCISAALPVFGSVRASLLPYSILTRPLTHFMFFILAIAFACLTVSFVQNDFSVAYVANHSNTQLPLRYRIVSVWGGHEGSLLLWILILSGWASAVAAFSKSLPMVVQTRVLSVMSAVSIGFLLFIIMTSNPFDRYLPIFPADGQDLNPLLQDIGLIIHPPMLYMGYVGFSVAFSFAIAGLWTGQLDNLWARWARPWVLAAWSFLTVGIALGSWWAYYELGWGGWWFWDPVENASFMPWLVGTALLHSLIVTDKRGVFKSWTVLLAILAFCLSLLGTFLVRSGVLTSVHAFANDPERGFFILVYLCVVTGGSLSLFAWRASQFKSSRTFALWSKESALLINNILLCVAVSCVLIGTLYPLFAAALDWRRVSIGPPYFNLFFAPLALLCAAFMALAPRLMWKEQRKKLNGMVVLIGVSVLLSLLIPYLIFSTLHVWVVLSTGLAFWVVGSLCKDIMDKSALRGVSFLSGLSTLGAGYQGMVLAHVGFVMLLIGASYTSHYSVERDVRMSVRGAAVSLEEHQFKLMSVTRHEIENYSAQRATIRVTNNDGDEFMLYPEKRVYPVQKNVMTEAAIDGALFRDIYVAMGEALDDGNWSMRVYYKPFVRWIWLGALFIAFGGALAIWDKRYARERRQKQAQTNTASSKAGNV